MSGSLSTQCHSVVWDLLKRRSMAGASFGDASALIF